MDSQQKNINDLIYGKNEIDRIVGLEVDKDEYQIFRLNEDLNIETITLPYRYWILCSRPLGPGWAKLEGDLHYKWGKQFSSSHEYFKTRKILKTTADTYSVTDFKESGMLKDGITFYKGLKPKDIPILSFDLETTGLDPYSDTAMVLLISNTFRKGDKVIKKLFSYDEYSSQTEFIKAWETWVLECDPSIICGHNIFGFDLPYLMTILEKDNKTLNIGRSVVKVRQNDWDSSFRVDGSRDLSYKKIHVYGREVIDTMFLAYRYDIATKKYESYGLKSIIKTEKLEKDDRQFYDASQIRFNYTKPDEWNKIKAYCVDDSDDSLMLFDLMAPAQFYMTQSIPRTFQQVHESATGAQINGVLVRAYLQKKHSIPKASEVQSFQGGISFGIPGIYRKCWKLDIKSAYPSSILIYKLYDKDKDPNAFMLKLCEYFTNQRFFYKKKYKETNDEYFKAMDAAAKIFINSIFGFCGAMGLNFNCPGVAAKITEAARDFLNKGMVWGTSKDKEYWLNVNS